MQYTTENTEGYSPEDLVQLNRIYDHLIALLNEDERENPDYLQHISEQILEHYDLARYTVDGSTSDKLIKLMEAPYEKTLAVHDAETGAKRGDNLLITNFDNRTILDENSNFVSVIHIRERHSYTAIDGGYDETVVVEGNRERLREGVRRALNYAREHGLRVQCNNPHVREDIKSGILDAAGLLVVDSVQRTIVDGRDRRKGGVDHNDWNL